MKWDDNIIEENDVLVSQWDGKSRDDTCKDVEKFCSSVEFMSFMDKGEEALIDSLSNHFPTRDELGIQLVENILKIVTLDGLLRVEEV